MAVCKKCGAEVMEGAMFCTECGEALAQPFEVNTKPSSNPFSELEQNVPKPEVSSTLIFEDPVADYKEGQESKDWSNQSNYGKPQYDANASSAGTETTGTSYAGYSFSGGSQENNSAAGEGNASPFGAFAAGAAGNTNPGAGANNPYNGGAVNYNSPQYSTSDMQGNDKIFAILCYFSLLLWAVAYFASGNGGYKSNYLKTHLNQGLILSLASIIGAAVLSGWAESIFGLIVFALCICGIVFAAKGQDRELPVVGQFRIIK